MTEDPVLVAEELYKEFSFPIKTPILRGVNLRIFREQTVAITGRSGEGKSTLLHILGTLDSPSSGRLKIAGQDVSSVSLPMIRNKHLGFVFQSFHLLEEDSVIDNVLMPLKIARVPTHKKSAGYEKALHLLERVGLSHRAFHLAKLLSGGEKQRVTLARALCNDPDLILADEPSGNLDAENAALIHALLIDFAKKEKKALVIVTHDRELAKLCDVQYQLREGKLYDNHH